jgi:thymidine kinase
MWNGYLEMCIGPMFSGKTTQLIQKYRELMNENKNVVVVNHTFDTRYGDNVVSNHDYEHIPGIFSNTIGEILEKLYVADYILINEAQFFPDIYELTILLVEKYNKHVALYGLDGDFQRKSFGRFLDLIPYSNDIVKRRAKCMECKYVDQPASFSHRLTNHNEQIVIGTSNYKPLCRKCYIDANTTM